MLILINFGLTFRGGRGARILENFMNPVFYPEVAKILSIKNDDVCCPFCNSVIFLRNSHISEHNYYSTCRCKAWLHTSCSPNEGIYFISYFVYSDDFSYRIQYNFSQGKVWIKKSVSVSRKEEHWEFAIDKINFLFENADQIETYLLFS